jgi:hypothetical protein
MDAIFAWMADLGIRLDDHEPDARQLAHMEALREAKREANRGTTRISRLARRIGLEPVRTTTEPAPCACAA